MIFRLSLEEHAPLNSKRKQCADADAIGSVDGRGKCGCRLICGSAKRGVPGASRNTPRQSEANERTGGKERLTPRRGARTRANHRRVIILAAGNVIYSYLFAPSDTRPYLPETWPFSVGYRHSNFTRLLRQCADYDYVPLSRRQRLPVTAEIMRIGDTPEWKSDYEIKERDAQKTKAKERERVRRGIERFLCR